MEIKEFVPRRGRQWRIQDFVEVGGHPSRGRQHTILPKFPQNCMKLKEFGPREGGRSRIPRTPLRSATGKDRPSVEDRRMGEGRPPTDQKFSEFRAVLGKIWQI